MSPSALRPLRAFLPALLMTFATLAMAPVAAQQVQPIDGIAAVVDEDVILHSELAQALANVRSQYAGREAQLPPLDVLRKQVLDRLVLVELQVARAKATGLQASDAEVDRAVAAIAQQGGGTVETLAAQLAADGLSLAAFRETVRDELLIQQLRQRFAQSQIRVSDAEVDSALESQDTRQYRLAHILVAVPEGASSEQISTGQEKINGIRSLVERGEMDFAAAAVRYSDSPNALEGGDLGWRTLDEIPAAFGEAVASMQPGQMLGPVPGPSGFQLLQLVEVRDAAQGGQQMVTEYQARHILVRTTDTVPPAEAKAKIDTVHARLVGGADFAEVARDSSEDIATAAQGGDLGWFPGGAFGPEFAAQLPALADGGFSAPFRTVAGWHIVQRLDSRQNDASEQNRRAQVREMIGRRKLEDEWNRFLRDMRGEAFVESRIEGPASTSGG